MCFKDWRDSVWQGWRRVNFYHGLRKSEYSFFKLLFLRCSSLFKLLYRGGACRPAMTCHWVLGNGKWPCRIASSLSFSIELLHGLTFAIATAKSFSRFLQRWFAAYRHLNRKSMVRSPFPESRYRIVSDFRGIWAKAWFRWYAWPWWKVK